MSSVNDTVAELACYAANDAAAMIAQPAMMLRLWFISFSSIMYLNPLDKQAIACRVRAGHFLEHSILLPYLVVDGAVLYLQLS